MTNQDYIRTSLELNLFFQRIMKEHLFFLQTNMQSIAGKYIRKANGLKIQFEQLLCNTLRYADGAVSRGSIVSEEFVTPYTLQAEETTAMLTGTGINTRITKTELNLTAGAMCYDHPQLLAAVNTINNRSLCLLEETISFQRHLLAEATSCKIFISVYPQMLEHDIREAEHYSQMLQELLNCQSPEFALCDELNFWNTIMAEHALFVDGMLNPNEEKLKKIAEDTAREFECLVDECCRSSEEQILLESLCSTKEIRTFKTEAVEGLMACRIKSIIPPLLADHVLREANHYLRLLKMYNG